jgi:hypothetical protein
LQRTRGIFGAIAGTNRVSHARRKKAIYFPQGNLSVIGAPKTAGQGADLGIRKNKKAILA